jgi:cytochrome c-type biogenesis protein CcmH
MNRKLLFLPVILVVLCSFSTRQVFAQQPTPSDDDVNELAGEMYCPVCENTPLDVCPTKACAQWRDLIRQKLQEGWSKDQIKNYFANQYGDQVLAEPSTNGSNWLIYILPPIMILLAAAVVFNVIKTARKNARTIQSSSSSQPGSVPESYLDKVENELEQYKKR